VKRQKRFLRANPSVAIHSPRQTGKIEWLATWDQENGSTTITRYELRSILDVLEERFGVPGKDGSESEQADVVALEGIQPAGGSGEMK
jgi:hypothetical protein